MVALCMVFALKLRHTSKAEINVAVKRVAEILDMGSIFFIDLLHMGPPSAGLFGRLYLTLSHFFIFSFLGRTRNRRVRSSVKALYVFGRH